MGHHIDFLTHANKAIYGGMRTEQSEAEFN